jgi:UDP-N-acetylglucosamine 4,6-dehydratase
MDMAKAIAPECDIEFIGIRPGEKLHETLITEEDGVNTIEYNGIYIILPTHAWWKRQNYNKNLAVPKGFSYSSDNNDEWLTAEDLQKIISRIRIDRRTAVTTPR